MTFRYQGPPPPERPNWSTLNSSQRRYAVRQYNLGRARRGLPEYTFDDSVTDPEDDSPAQLQSQSSVQTISDSQSTSSTGEEDTYYGDVGFRLAQVPEHRMADVASTSKRPADDGGSGAADSTATKKPKTTTKLPGTGSQGAGDPDTGNPSAENVVIPRPIADVREHTMVFRKHHCLLSYGVAWKILVVTGHNGVNITTTSLMELPVDRPYFYLSPSEYKMLPSNCYVKNVRVKVVMRNPRTAFETNATDSALATLNQNKFGCFGVGLTAKTGGVNRTMVFGTSTSSMIPNDSKEVSFEHRKAVVKHMYGCETEQYEPAIHDFNVAHSFLNLPFHHNSYFCLVKSQVYSTVGWPQLAQHMTKADASFLVGKTVMDYSYSPTVGLITVPYKLVSHRWLTNTSNTDFKNSRYQYGQIFMNTPKVGSSMVMDFATGDVTSNLVNVTDTELSDWETITNKKPYYMPIEKCQYIKKGMDTVQKSSVQPSCHVGIYPVPRLTTNDQDDIPNEFTDVQVQWDVDAEIELGWTYPTNYMQYAECCYEPEDCYYSHVYSQEYASTEPCFRDSRSTIRGGYVSSVKAGANENVVASETYTRPKRSTAETSTTTPQYQYPRMGPMPPMDAFLRKVAEDRPSRK